MEGALGRKGRGSSLVKGGADAKRSVGLVAGAQGTSSLWFPFSL